MSDVDLTFLCNRVCTIDPYRAAVILKHVNYPLNRKKDARVIKSYRDAMMEHNWMRPIDISFVAVPVDTVPPEYRNGNGCIQNLQYFLVNGQHRLQALIESGTTQTANITVLNVEHWDSIGKVYSSFDTDIRKRTTSQIVAAANVTPMLNEKYRSATYKNNALRAMGFIIKEFEIVNPALYAVSISSPRMLDEMASWEKELIQYFDILSTTGSVSHKKYLMSPVIVALGIISLRNNRAVAEDFWKGVANRSDLNPDDPRKVLADWIDDNYKKKDDAPVTVNKKKTYAIAEAWNRFYNAKDMNRRALLNAVNRGMKQDDFVFSMKNCYTNEKRRAS